MKVEKDEDLLINNVSFSHNMNENLQKVHIEKKIIFQQQLSNTSEMYKQLTELNNEILPHHQETEGFEITNDDLESEIVTMEEIIEEEVIGSPQSISFDLNLSIRKEPIDMSIVWAHVEEVIEKVIQEVSANVTDDEVDLYRERIKLQAKRSRVKHDPMSVPFHYAGQTFNIQSQKLILNALHFLKTHRKDDIPLSVKTPQEKAAKLLNISSSVIGKVRKNWKKGKLEQAGTRRRMAKRILDRVSPQDEEVILGIIRDLDDNGVTPTIPLILAAARVQVKFVGSRTSFRRILNRMGFRYGKLDKTVVMIDPKGGTIPNVGVNTGKVTPISANQGKNKKKSTNISNSSPNLNPPPPLVQIQRKEFQKTITTTVEEVEDASTEVLGVTSDQSNTSDLFRLIPMETGYHLESNGILLDAGTELQGGEYVFELDGQNICFQLLRSTDEPLIP